MASNELPAAGDAEKGNLREPNGATSPGVYPPAHDSDHEHSDGIDREKEEAAAQPPPQSAPKGPPLPEVPDGGLEAWLQVAGGYSLFFNTWGNLNTFGIFQTYYEEGKLFHQSSSNIAWIGAIQAFLLLVIGSVSGPIFDRGYLRLLIGLGSFLVVFGYMMLSICKEFWQVILAQGFCIGIGGGLLFTPAVALLPGYFRRRLGLAVGLAAAGSSMGGVIYPIVFYRLIDRIGFGWTTRVIGFIALGTLLVPNLVSKQRIKPAKARSLFDPTALTDAPYLLFIFGCFIGFIGLYCIFFYISFYGGATGIASTKLSFYIVPILNAASVFGRTLPNALSDKIGTFNLLAPGALVCSILLFCMIAVKSLGALIAVAILFGFFSGVFIALPPVCFAMLTQDKSKIGTRIGMGFGFIGFSVLLGGPAAGAILGTNGQDLHWKHTWIYGGVLAMGSAIVFTSIRFMKAGGKLVVKI